MASCGNILQQLRDAEALVKAYASRIAPASLPVFPPARQHVATTLDAAGVPLTVSCALPVCSDVHECVRLALSHSSDDEDDLDAMDLIQASLKRSRDASDDVQDECAADGEGDAAMLARRSQAAAIAHRPKRQSIAASAALTCGRPAPSSPISSWPR